MASLKIATTDRSPAVLFDFDNHHLKISGESYPEDVSTFYHPVFEALTRTWLAWATAAAASISS